ncbi:MAG TPA: ATP-binding protein [Desulfuromonadales bacterium]|nr:ATP-binding protein [Desulfuromonadales bacterium]
MAVNVCTIRLTIDSDLAEVRQVRRALSVLVGEGPLSPEEWYQVKVCIAEAVNNAIIHAYGRQGGHPVEVEVERLADRVVCRIADFGKPMPAGVLQQKPQLDYCPKDVARLPEGGMGLYIMHQVMDRVEYESKNGRNVLILTRLARRDEAGPEA